MHPSMEAIATGGLDQTMENTRVRGMTTGIIQPKMRMVRKTGRGRVQGPPRENQQIRPPREIRNSERGIS